MRAGLDWSQLDFVAKHRDITAPILLFRGIHDQFVPEAASAAYARALPRQVTFIPIEQANPVEAWNADPARYAANVHQWCDSLGIGRSPQRAVCREPSAQACPSAFPCAHSNAGRSHAPPQDHSHVHLHHPRLHHAVESISPGPSPGHRDALGERYEALGRGVAPTTMASRRARQ